MELNDAQAKALTMLKKKAALTEGMAEFVIKIDMNLDAPIVNTGCIIPINMGQYTQLWAVVNMEEFGSFIPAEGLKGIKDALESKSKKAIDKINKICPTAVCMPFVPAVSMDMLKTPEIGDLIMAVHLMNGYLKNKYNRLCGCEINYCHFAARCHVYFNGYPAGLGAGTDIMMAGNKFTPHLITKLKPDNQVFLVDFIPKRREMTLVTGSKQQFVARPESFAFPESTQLKMSEMAATLTQFLAIYETQCKQIVDATKQETEKKKPAAKRKTSKKTK